MNIIRRSILTTVVLVLACSGLVAVSAARSPAPATSTAPAAAPAADVAVSADLGQATLIDCWYEEQWDYEESYADGEEMVTVYAAYQRKCWDTGGGVQCGEWHFIGWREVRTGGSGGLGD